MANVDKCFFESPAMAGRLYKLGSVCPSVRLSVHPSVHLSIHPSVHPSVRPSVFLEV